MRRATIRTELAHAKTVAAAVRPDNTSEMTTSVEDENAENRSPAIVTTIERDTTGGLQSTVDDYVVNVDVAVRTVEQAIEHRNTQT